jgi:hypothetical protein
VRIGRGKLVAAACAALCAGALAVVVAPRGTAKPVTAVMVAADRGTAAAGAAAPPPPASSNGPRRAPSAALGPVALTGCPPPPPKPGPPAHPWHPTVLIPDSALPAPPKPAPRLQDLSAITGKGMWIWQMQRSEGGDSAAIVRQAVSAGLSQLWVRVGDSRNGFYGQSFLGPLVTQAHRAGLAVIGWGFPYLYDPAGDAAWTAAALGWRAAGGDRLDGFAADIETSSEGTALSALRSSTYLGLVRPAAAGRPLVATVFPPTDHWLALYPYQAMAPFIDAFVPMVYWSCTEPGDAVGAAINRLASLAPVHPLGQGYDMASEGGRVGPPSAAEISRFLDVCRRMGALGASFWDWQEMNDAEWGALSRYPWGLGGVTGTGQAGA